MHDKPPSALAWAPRRRVGKIAASAGALTILLSAAAPAQAIDNPGIERLATCQDSWLEWKKNDPTQLKKFADDFRSGFLRNENDAFFVPRSSQTVIGLPIRQVFPEGVGMGVGFSVIVNANFEKTRATVERKIGRSLKQCETGDNMRTCELEVGDKKTITLMAEDNQKSSQPFWVATTSIRNEAVNQRKFMSDPNPMTVIDDCIERSKATSDQELIGDYIAEALGVLQINNTEEDAFNMLGSAIVDAVADDEAHTAALSEVWSDIDEQRKLM